MERPRLQKTLSTAAGSHRLTLLTAPAGYGKTMAVGDWVRTSDLRCAWLSLDRFDTRPARLFRGVMAAIQSAASELPRPGDNALLALDQHLAPDPAESYDLVLGALEQLAEPIALVIDDLHLAGTGLADGILGVLTASGPPTLRLVLSSRCQPPLRLERLRRGVSLGELRAADLAFTRDEVALLASSPGGGVVVDVEALWRATGGWPIAVHHGLGALARSGNPSATITTDGTMLSPFADYVAEEVLDSLAPSLADFVLRATTCDCLGSRLAVELYGQPDGGLLLQECLHNGLFVEEYHHRGGESMCRWHPLFAAQCRGILERRDPLLAESLHRVAARHYQDTDVGTSVAQALWGRDPLQALMSLGAHWLEFVLRDDIPGLEQLCLELPAPWSEDPEILMIRSACRGLAGDSGSASELTRRALAGASALDAARRRRFEISRGLFELFLIGDRPDLPDAADEGRSLVDAAADGHPATHATALFLRGQAEVRLRRDGEQAITLLRAASAAGRADRLEAVEVCSAAELTLAFAEAGDLVAADNQAVTALERAEASGWGSPEPMAPIWLARGITCYWKDDLEHAHSHLTKALRIDSRLSSLGPITRLYRVLVDCATRNPHHLAESSAALHAADDRRISEWPWNGFQTIAEAKITEAKGDLDGALAIAQPLGSGGHSPLVDTVLAELLRRGGEVTAATRCAESLTGRRRNSYIDTSMALTEALLAHAAGDSATAHERIEHAAHRAEPQSVLRPFAERSDDLAELLAQHAAWSTAHEPFIAARSAQHTSRRSQRPRSHWDLTERERELLAYLRSMMTLAEIAQALFVSVNTVKTHQRSIYRKLGAASRREALSIAAARGIL
jgi:LuxR family maltose regulon positive regulatory protein